MAATVFDRAVPYDSGGARVWKIQGWRPLCRECFQAEFEAEEKE